MLATVLKLTRHVGGVLPLWRFLDFARCLESAKTVFIYWVCLLAFFSQDFKLFVRLFPPHQNLALSVVVFTAHLDLRRGDLIILTVEPGRIQEGLPNTGIVKHTALIHEDTKRVNRVSITSEIYSFLRDGCLRDLMRA